MFGHNYHFTRVPPSVDQTCRLVHKTFVVLIRGAILRLSEKVVLPGF